MKTNKTLLSAIFCALSITTLNAQTVSDPDLGDIEMGVQGFAAVEGTEGTPWFISGATTGGNTGDVKTLSVVMAENLQQLSAYAQSKKPYVILVRGHIAPSIKAYISSENSGTLTDAQDGSEGIQTTFAECINVASNKTIIGLNNATLERVALLIKDESNIVIQNLNINMANTPVAFDYDNIPHMLAFRDGAITELGEPAIITVSSKDSTDANPTSHIWIDHCDLTNNAVDKLAKDESKERFGELINISGNVQFVTISYCHFHDNPMGLRFGIDRFDLFDNTRTISFHHNLIENITDCRVPMQHGGTLHYSSNIMKNCNDGWELHNKAVAYLESCIFEDTKDPIKAGNEGESLSACREKGYNVTFSGCKTRLKGYKDAKVPVPLSYASFAPTQWRPESEKSYVVTSTNLADLPTLLDRWTGPIDYDYPRIYLENKKIPSVSQTSYQEALRTAKTGNTYDAKGKTIKSNTKK